MFPERCHTFYEPQVFMQLFQGRDVLKQCTNSVLTPPPYDFSFIFSRIYGVFLQVIADFIALIIEPVKTHIAFVLT